MSFKVLNNPFLATIQDKGRFGYSHIGVTNSGAMDEYSYYFANYLLRNPLDTNIIEVSLPNIVLQASKDTQIAITGAQCEFFINNELKDTWRSYNIKRYDILKIGKILKGNRVYLGIYGGFEIKKDFGSNSVTIKERIGGLYGNKLKINDVLPYKENNFNYISKLKNEFIPKYNEIITLRVMFSYQEKLFLQNERNKLLSSSYTVTHDFNRMAVKLHGESIKCLKDGIISEGIAFGSIQIPKDGQPIILLKDRQTIGGYPKIGVILSLDCFALSQARANTKINFKEISFEDGLNETKSFYSIFV